MTLSAPHRVLFALALSASMAWSAGAEPPPSAEGKTKETHELRRGEPLPAFSLSTLDGATVTPESLRGRITVLFFGATWCPYSKRMAGAADAFHREYAPKGVASYLVNVRETPEKAKAEWREKKGLSVPVLLDVDAVLTRAVAPPPELCGKMKAENAMNARYIVLDKEGRIHAFPFVTKGLPDWDLVGARRAVDELLTAGAATTPGAKQ